jgi:signal transduction histidine kinase
MLRVQFESKIGNGIEAGPETVMRFPVFHFYGHFFGRSGGTSRLPWAAVWLSLACVAAQAQSSPYRFDHWTTDNGLPQNTVTSLVQTRDGYLWLTTFDGLARFDGVRFTVFDKSNTKDISTNRFTNLYETRDGSLLIATEDAGLIVYRNGTFTNYTTVAGLPSNQVLEFFPDFDGQPVIATAKGSVYLRDGKIVPAAQYQNPQTKLYLAPSGTRVTIEASGVTRVNDGRTIHYPIKFAAQDFSAEVMPYEDSRGNLWIREKQNLYLLRDGQITSFPGIPPLRPMCEDADGGVWFGKPLRLEYAGDFLARFQDGRFTFFGEADGVLKASIRSVIRDREGSIWIATTRGLYRARKRMMAGYSTESGLASHEVYPLAQSRDGVVWIGTTRGASRGEPSEGRVARFSSFLPGTNVQSFWEDATGRMWIGTNTGLLRYENGKRQDFAMNAEVYGVRADRAGNYWVASHQGIFKLDGDKIVAHYTTKDGLPNNDVKTLHQDRSGRLWFGTYGGLVEFKDGRFITYTAAQGLAGNRVRAIYEDADGTLWIGTYEDGLSRLRDGKFFNYRMEQGLFNNGIFQILEDRRGYFWIGCNKGIYRVSRRELNDVAEARAARVNSVAFGKRDGMLNTECNGGRQSAGFVAEDGQLWFPTMAGVVVIDPEAAPVNSLPPPVVIEAVTLERGLVDFSQGVTIAPGQRDLEIAYTGLSLHKPEQVQFRYKLEGLDTDWVEAGTRRVAYFPYLSPGSYTFRALAANSDGVWNTEGASLRIVVEPPFWRRWWFIALVSLGVAGTVWLIFRQRVARLRASHAAQEQFSRQLLDSQEQERQRIAAELHDSLGQSLLIIKNRSFLALDSFDDPKAAREQVEEISEASAHAIEEVREIAYNLRPYKIERFGLTKTLQALCQQAGRTSGIRFVTELKNIDGLFPNEAELNLYRVVQESVNNILKHSRATEAKLTIERNGREALLKIEDNGQGFKAAPQAGANESRRGGFGLIGMAERVRLLGGAYTMDSAPGRGTTITVKLMIPEENL